MKNKLLQKTKIIKMAHDLQDHDELQLQHVAGSTVQNQHIESTDETLESILKLSLELIRIPSIDDNRDALDQVLSLAGNHLKNFIIEPFLSNGYHSILVHNAKPGTKKFKIILNAHLDVVPGKQSQFQPYIKDGKLYGRGSFDMKAAASVMIHLFKDIAAQIPYPIALQLVTEEELVDGNGTEYQLASGISTDFAILGECGSNLDIVNETKGLISAQITTTGYSAHGAYLWKGENAIMKMHDVLSIIKNHYPVPTTETNETTINISSIKTSNTAWNLVPDNCTAFLDIRFGKSDRDIILTKLKSLLPEGVDLKIDQIRNNHFTDPKNKFIKQLSKAGKIVTGHKLKTRPTFGGSDTIFFSNAGCNSIEFGPIGHGQHHDDEWVDIQSLKDYYQILKNFLLQLK